MKKIFLSIVLFSTITTADIFSTPSSLDEALSTYGGESVDQILSDLESSSSVLNILFSDHAIDSIVSDMGGDSELMQCIASGIDFGSIGGGGMGNLGGLCDLLDMGSLDMGGFNLGELSKCVGMSMPDLGLDSLKNFCSGSTPSADSGAGGIVSETSTSNPSGWSYSSPVASASATIDLDGVSEETTQNPPKKAGDRTYPSGITGEELYATNGGLLNKSATEHPSASLSQSIKSFDKPSLVLADLALKSIGVEDPSVMKLPLTKKDAIDTEDAMANQIQAATTNFHDLIDTLVVELQNQFKSIEADTLAEYYKKEKEKFASYISSSDALKAHYTASAKAIKLHFASKIFIATGEKSYIDDPSEARASLMDEKQRIAFRYAALLQQYKSTLLKTDLALAIKRNKERIDIAVRQAYVRASLFREDIAKKELDAMLRAVDTLIR